MCPWPVETRFVFIEFDFFLLISVHIREVIFGLCSPLSLYTNMHHFRTAGTEHANPVCRFGYGYEHAEFYGLLLVALVRRGLRG